MLVGLCLSAAPGFRSAAGGVVPGVDGSGGRGGGGWGRVGRELCRGGREWLGLFRGGVGRGGWGGGRRRSALRIWRRLRRPVDRRAVWRRRPGPRRLLHLQRGRAGLGGAGWVGLR